MAEEKSIVKQIIHEIGEWLYAIIIALAIAIVVHLFLGQITRVSGESMEDTLHNGDFLVVSKLDHIQGNMPQYGDIVIIDSVLIVIVPGKMMWLMLYRTTFLFSVKMRNAMMLG